MSIVIKTHGEFYYKTENLKGRKPFEQVIKAQSLDFFKQVAVRYTGTDDEGKLKFVESEFINVRGIIKKKLLPLLLAPRFSDFVRVRSVTIDEIILDQGAKMDLPVTLQSRNQLIQLCKEKKYPIEAVSYMNIDELRTDVLEYQTDPDVFLRTLERKNKVRSQEREFLSLNGLLSEEILQDKLVSGPKNTGGSVSHKPMPSAPQAVGGIADL